MWVLKYFGVRVGFETGLEVMRADLEPGCNFDMGLSPHPPSPYLYLSDYITLRGVTTGLER